nr:radical SAM protein [Pelosinus baikalensis]
MKFDELWEFRARERLWSTPNLSLLTMAGMLPQEYQVEYIDQNYIEVLDLDYQLAFFSPSTSQAYKAYELADKLRENGVLVMMGGAHVSVLPQEALKHADAIFIGEAEETFPVFLDDIKRGKPKLIYKSLEPPNLNLSPVPRYDLAKKFPYKSIPVQTSRGCPHQCNFCISSKLYGRKIRRKSIQQVESELIKIMDLYQNPFIFFTDDNFLRDLEYGRELMNILKKFGLKWYAFTDASIVDQPDLLENAAKSGCSRLLIGFESLEPKNLVVINQSKWKLKKWAQYKQIIAEIQSHGIGVVGSFIVGMDEDTKEVFDILYNFINETCLYATNITVLTPFPGTTIYKMLQTENRITTNDWTKYNGFKLTYTLKSISKHEFERGFENLSQRLNSSERINNVINYYKEIMNAKIKNKTACDLETQDEKYP